MDKTYKIIKLGKQKGPNLLENTTDSKDVLALCSCGHTKNAEGHCDGSHNKIEDHKCDCGKNCC